MQSSDRSKMQGQGCPQEVWQATLRAFQKESSKQKRIGKSGGRLSICLQESLDSRRVVELNSIIWQRFNAPVCELWLHSWPQLFGASTTLDLLTGGVPGSQSLFGLSTECWLRVAHASATSGSRRSVLA